MGKSVLSLKYENEKTNTEITSWTGLPVYLELSGAIWLSKSIEKHLKIRKGGRSRVKLFMFATTL